MADTEAGMAAADSTDLYLRAHALRERGDFEAASAGYREFLAAQPPGPPSKAMLKGLVGQIHCANGLQDWRGMEALARRVVDDYPDHPAGPLLLGEALLRQGRHAEAAARLEAAVSLDGASAEARDLLQVARAGASAPQAASGRPRPWPPRTPRFSDLKDLARKYLLEGLPGRLKIRPDHTLMTLGSCFAEHLALRLQAQGYKVGHEPIGEEVNTTFANRYLLEWIERGAVSGPTRAMESAYGPELRARLAAAIAGAHVFILTFGVAPCFFQADTGEFVFSSSHTPVARRFLNERCVMRTTTVAENVLNIRRMVESLRRLAPHARGVVMTVSPVPLSGTTELSSAIMADCISKSTLRLACHEALANLADPRLHYWPSFEMVRWITPHLGPDHPPAFGAEDGNSRHVSAWLVAAIIDLFLEHHAAAADPGAPPH